MVVSGLYIPSKILSSELGTLLFLPTAKSYYKEASLGETIIATKP